MVGTGDVVLVVLAFAGQTNPATTLDLFLPTSETDRQTDGPFYGAMVQRRDGPSWLRDDDDNDIAISSLGDRAFAVAGPRAWNSLPEFVTDCSSPLTFEKYLKTYLFSLS